MASPQGTDSGPGPDPSALGRAAAGRFARPGPRRGGARRPVVGSLARRSAAFSHAAGRSIVARRSLGGATPGVDTSGLPVRLDPRLWGLAELADTRRSASISGDREIDRLRRLTGGRPRATASSVPPRGLPRASNRSRDSKVGRATGPAGAAGRLRPAVASIPSDPAVRAAGSGTAAGPAAFPPGASMSASAPGVVRRSPSASAIMPLVSPSPATQPGSRAGSPASRAGAPGSSSGAGALSARSRSGARAGGSSGAIPASSAGAPQFGPVATPSVASVLRRSASPRPPMAPSASASTTVTPFARAAGSSSGRDATSRSERRPEPHHPASAVALAPVGPSRPARPHPASVLHRSLGPGGAGALARATSTSIQPPAHRAPLVIARSAVRPAPSGYRSSTPEAGHATAGPGGTAATLASALRRPARTDVADAVGSSGRPGLTAATTTAPRPSGRAAAEIVSRHAASDATAGSARPVVRPAAPAAMAVRRLLASHPGQGRAGLQAAAPAGLAAAPPSRALPVATRPSPAVVERSAATPAGPTTTRAHRGRSRSLTVVRLLAAATSGATTEPGAARTGGAVPRQPVRPAAAVASVGGPPAPSTSASGSRLPAASSMPSSTSNPAQSLGRSTSPSSPSARPSVPSMGGRPVVRRMADRFAAVAAQRSADPVRPLPPSYHPLAQVITGGRSVGFASGPTSRAALSAAGTTAATVGSVIHLPRPPAARPGPSDLATVAHELVHAARPSTIPRMHGDDHRSGEEHLADRIERTVGSLARRTAGRSAPVISAHRSTGTAGLPVGGTSGFASALSAAGPGQAAGLADAVRRASGSSAPSAAGGAASPSSVPGSSANVIRRKLHGSASSSSSSAGAAPSSPGTSASASPASEAPVAPAPASPSAVAPGGSPSPAEREFEDRVVEAVRRRVIADLERRGLADPGVLW